MDREAVIRQIQEDFQFTTENPEIKGVLLFGSYAVNYAHPLSDIDICIVVPHQKISKMYDYIMENLTTHIENYDIQFFEELPLQIQGQIIEKGIVTLCKDIPALYEYFASFRLDWEDFQYVLKNSM
jgi:predicted nucleotidyltransferase